MTVSLILLVLAFVAALLALLEVPTRFNLTALAVMLVVIYIAVTRL